MRDKNAPEDYWGDWSSDEEGSSRDSQKEVTNHHGHPLGCEVKDSDDSEDEYYTRWSKDPGTLTPGPDDEAEEQDQKQPGGRILSHPSALQQEEYDEEYDQSYNPLFTVPSVPNLMDAHSAALSELTHMLQNSLPGQPPHAVRASNKFVQPMTQINPLPKAVSRLRSSMEEMSLEEQPEQQQQQKNSFPGAYPESGTQSPARKASTSAAATNEEAATATVTAEHKEAGRGLFMKSLSALIGAARLLGYEGKDILEMVQEIVNKP